MSDLIPPIDHAVDAVRNSASNERLQFRGAIFIERSYKFQNLFCMRASYCPKPLACKPRYAFIGFSFDISQ